MSATVKLYYANIRNMGDQLNVLLLERLFGLRVERRSFLDGELCAIGSCLGQYTLHGGTAMRLRQRVNGLLRPDVSVWGTGFIRRTDCESPFFKRNMRFFALRGELTRRDVERMTGQETGTAVGDPGLLVRRLFPELPAKRFRVGIVPHVCDICDERIPSLLAAYPDSCLIDVREEPLTVLRQIASCETIFSSSLHGLVAADSFGIPNRHAVLSDRPLGDGYKFNDYYSAFSVPHIFTDLRSSPPPTAEEIRSARAVTDEAVQRLSEGLLDAFERIRQGGNA